MAGLQQPRPTDLFGNEMEMGKLSREEEVRLLREQLGPENITAEEAEKAIDGKDDLIRKVRKGKPRFRSDGWPRLTGSRAHPISELAFLGDFGSFPEPSLEDVSDSKNLADFLAERGLLADRNAG